MEPQNPAKGISLTNTFNDASSYHIECDCSSHDHSVSMWIELSKDSKINTVELTFYVTTRSKYWENWRQRLGILYEVLFKGLSKQEHTLILSQQSAINLANVIVTNVNELKGKK